MQLTPPTRIFTLPHLSSLASFHHDHSSHGFSGRAFGDGCDGVRSRGGRRSVRSGDFDRASRGWCAFAFAFPFPFASSSDKSDESDGSVCLAFAVSRARSPASVMCSGTTLYWNDAGGPRLLGWPEAEALAHTDNPARA